MPAFHDLTNKRFGKLFVLRRGHTRAKRTLWVCRCSCGVVIEVRADHLLSGASQTCGCRYERHGKCPANRPKPEYAAYQREKHLCRNPRIKFYEYYGGRGIQFRFANFRQFYAEVGDKPSPHHWLMRIDSDGHFESGNLHWVMKKIRRRSKRQSK